MLKFFVIIYVETLTNKIKSCYAVTNEFINKKLITILTNEKLLMNLMKLKIWK